MWENSTLVSESLYLLLYCVHSGRTEVSTEPFSVGLNRGSKSKMILKIGNMPNPLWVGNSFVKIKERFNSNEKQSS